MTIKERINKKIQQYKDDFLNETGFDIIVIPNIYLPKVEVDRVISLCEDFWKIDNGDLLKYKTNNKNKGEYRKQRSILSGILFRMMYSDKEIASTLGIQRASVSNLKTLFSSSMCNIGFRHEFYQLLEYIYINTVASFVPTGEWHERTKIYDTVFEVA